MNKYPFLLLLIVLLSSCYVSAWTPTSNIDMRYYYHFINGSDVNATQFFQNGSAVLDSDDINGTTFNYSSFSNSSFYWDNLNTTETRWLYDSNGVLTYNETLQNNSIDNKISTNNVSVNSYINSQDIAFNNSMKSYVDAQDISYNSTMTTYVNLQNSSMKTYVDARDVVYNNSMVTYTAATYIPLTSEGDLNVNSSVWWALVSGWDNTWFINDANNLTLNDTRLNQTTQNYVDSIESTLNVNHSNSSEYWDNLNTPTDINAGDITNDGTYILSANEINLNVNSSSYWLTASSLMSEWLYVLTNVLSFNGTHLNDTIDSKISELNIEYNASTILNITGGVTSGNITSILSCNEDNIYNVSEVSGIPGFDVRINFTNTSEFNAITFRGYYNGSTGHTILVQLYNNDTSSWDTFGEITNQVGYTYTTLGVPDDAAYSDAGLVQARIYHSSFGVVSHIYELDCFFMEQGTGIVFGGDHDSLSGRDSVSNHPWAMDTAATRSFSSDVNFGAKDAYNILNLNATSVYQNGNMCLDESGFAAENITSGTIAFARLPNLTNAITLDRDNITNKFIESTDNIYLYMSGTNLTFNETKGNATMSALNTNAATICSGSQVLFGNGSCGATAGSGDITSVQGDGKYVYNGSDSADVLLAFNETQLNITSGLVADSRHNQATNTTSAVTFATVDTGQGANELYDMDQNVLTTSDVTHNNITSTTDVKSDTLTFSGQENASITTNATHLILAVGSNKIIIVQS